MPTLPKLFLFLIFSAPLVAFSQRSSGEYLKEGESNLTSNPQKAFALLEKAMNQATQRGENDIYFKSLYDLAELAEIDFPEYQENVFAWCKQALLKNGHQNTLPIARLYFVTANFYYNLTYETDSALNYFNKALKIRARLKSEMNEEAAACYHGLADCYKYRTYSFMEAEKCYEKALQIREQIASTDTFTLATNYYSLATTNRSQGDYEKALSYGLTTITFSKEIHSTSLLEQTYTVVANIYRDMHQSDKAKEYYQKEIEIILQNSKSPSLLAWNYVGLGETYKNDSLWNEAIRNFSKAILQYELMERTNTLSTTFKQLWLYCQLKMAEIYLVQKQYPKSLQLYHTSYVTLQRMDMAKGRQLVEVYNGLGNYYFLVQHYDSALNFYQRALATAIPSFKPKKNTENPTESTIGTNYYVHGILSSKAQVFQKYYEASGKQVYLIQSLACLRLAEKLMSQERNTLDMEESKWQFLDANFDVYEQIVSILFEQQKCTQSDSLHDLAFYYFEKSKARSLRDVLSPSISKTDTILSKQDDLKRSWFSTQHRLDQEQHKESPDLNRITSLRQQLVSVDRKLQINEQQIENKYPGYFRILFNPKISSRKAVQEFLGHENRVVLEYFCGTESVYGLAIDKDTIEFKRISSTDSIGFLTSQLSLHFSDDHSSLSQEVFVNFATSAYTLNELLLQPFHALMTKVKRVQIIPDGFISQIPFELLITEKPSLKEINYKQLKYALHQFTFGYAYSSTLLVSTHRAETRKPTLLAMGFTGGKPLRSNDIQLPTIDGAERELEVLKTYFENGKFIEGSAVTESNFKRLAPGFDIIHLAIHGRGDTQDQFASSLFFRTKNDSTEDGQLHAYELYGLKLIARLAVLTACESGLGKAYKGEGMLSMASAFSNSGCQNTLMSLWKVNDQASITLMGDFYAQLLNGVSLDEALLAAKLKYLEQADEFTADPKIWAPMIVYGSLDPILKKERSTTFYYLLGIVCVLLLSLSGWSIKKWKRRN